MRRIKIIFSAVVAFVITMTGSAPASAASTVNSAQIESVECISAYSELGHYSDLHCTRDIVLEVGPVERLTAVDLVAARGSLTPANFATLAAAYATGPVYGKSYSKTWNNLSDAQTQRGKFYYDGSRAWVTYAYRGFDGTHHCEVNWAVAIAVDLVACGEGGSSVQRDLYAQWHYSAIFKGFPVSWDEVHELHVNSRGYIW